MSFWIYKRDGASFSRAKTVKLTGTQGLLARYILQHSHEETPFTWQLTDRDIIHMAYADLDVEQHCLVFDMIPESPDEVVLYRVSHIQGASEMDESDVVLATKILYQNRNLGKAQALRESFILDQPESNRQMLEALRLTGGTFSGKFYWAKPKMDIGAAVCPSNLTTKQEIPQLVKA